MTEPREPDRVEGAPHPRETAQLFGQASAEAAFLDAFRSDRLHHGWMLTGPRGVGKATLAWRIARFLLAQPADAGMFAAPPESLDIPADHTVARRMAALSEGRLLLLRRAWDDKTGRLRSQITVAEARKLRDFLGLSAPDGGWRAVIVDAADEMNPSAANALLKLLEEPPAQVVLLLICHQPARLLPTIRSRCRPLRLAPLGPADMALALAQAGVEGGDPAALAVLAGGSVGAAVGLARLDGLALYGRIVALFSTLPRLDRAQMLALAELAAARGGEEKRALLFELCDLFLARLAAAGAGRPPATEATPGEAAVLTRLAPGPAAARAWAEAQARLGARVRAGLAVNLDPAALLIDMVLGIEAAAAAPAG
jgi:DNA polymerase-3 subunit delta'